MIKVHHANELLERLDCGGPGKLPDGINLGGQWCNAVSGDVVAKEV